MADLTHLSWTYFKTSKAFSSEHYEDPEFSDVPVPYGSRAINFTLLLVIALRAYILVNKPRVCLPMEVLEQMPS